MAILKAVNVKVGRNANLKGIITYVMKPQKTEDRLAYGYCCDVPTALETMNETKAVFGKHKGRQYYHFVLSFPPIENIRKEQAHAVAIQFAERCKKFWGFEMLLATHKDRKHIHTHFIMNSVSFVDGHKFHITKKELAQMKTLLNQLCIEQGYSAAPKKGYDQFGQKKKLAATNSKAFRIVQKALHKQADSYIQECAEAFKNALKIATTKEQFIVAMKSQGFETEWKDNKKHITFTSSSLKRKSEKKCKVRLNRLSGYFQDLVPYPTKEELINGLSRNIDNAGIIAQSQHENRRTDGTDSDYLKFNTEYEHFVARHNRESLVHTAEIDAGLTAETSRPDRNGVQKKQGPERSDDLQHSGSGRISR